MVSIYNEIIKQLSSISGINWVDMDRGQLNSTMPEVTFPCCLVSIDLPQCETFGDNLQKCKVRVIIRVGFQFTGMTSGATEESERLKSLSYLETVQDVSKSLQGFSTNEFNELVRLSQIEEKRPDKHKVVRISFDSEFVERFDS